MTLKEYREKVNPCYGCGCWDEEAEGFTMPGTDRDFACHLEIEKHAQEAKQDDGKLQLSLVPPEIINQISAVRMYGNQKYHDPDNWKTVEVNRWWDALLRHLMYCAEHGLDAKDPESGIPSLSHAACNLAFIIERIYGEKKD